MINNLPIKRLSFYLLFFVLAFTACQKEYDTAFDQSPDERLNATLSRYQSLLETAPYGWVGVVQPTGGGAYSFYMKFNNQNRVVMYSDFDSASAVTPRESSYRLKALQQPSLIFDTYSYLHLLADPNEGTITIQANINGNRGGRLGQGLQSDFEYALDSATDDRIMLTGRQHGTKTVLVKATQQEAAAYENEQLVVPMLQLQNLNKILYYFKRLTLGSKQYDVSINDKTKTIAITWIGNGGSVSTFNTTYYYTPTGINFVKPFDDGSQIITGFTNITWNDATGSFSLTANNTTGTLSGVNNPIAVDTDAPQRWQNTAIDNGAYWISFDGFHVNGVDDAYGLKTLTEGTWTYYYQVYWPQVGSGYDFFGPFFINQTRDTVDLFYGTAPRTPLVTSDGRAVFRELGTFGTHPATGPAALSRAQLYQSRGYYFVQTGPYSFDMVSAADARIWITWEL